MTKVKWSWLCVASAAAIVLGSAPAHAGSELSSLPPSPPLQQTIVYFGKATTSDFTGDGMAQHLQYFPAFGLTQFATGLRTDDDSCVELTPDFGDFQHHVVFDITGRTFSPDALGDPIGVKTEGGDASFEIFTLPDGSVGRSGSTYDEYACGNSTNTVNQIRVNSNTLQNFCLNLITDNTNGRFDPNVRISARSDNTDLVLEGNKLVHPDGSETIVEPDQALAFDGQTDMYTFRYMGMKEGDKIKIRIEDLGGQNCEGAGFGGIMVSHIDTCTPEPGTCTPSCEGKVCGDDGCGGSCGECPRVDKLVERSGHVTVTVGTQPPRVDADVESVVVVGDQIAELIEDVITSVGDSIEEGLVELFDHDLGFNVRNFNFKLARKLTIQTQALADGRFAAQIGLEKFDLKWKITPENEGIKAVCHDAVITVKVDTITLTGILDPDTGEITDIAGQTSPPDTDVDLDCAAVEYLPLILFPVPIGIPFAMPGIVIFPMIIDDVLADVVSDQFQGAFSGALGGLGEDLGIHLPIAALVPETLEIGGVDYGDQIRAALLYPPVGQLMKFVYDGGNPHELSGSAPVVVTELASLTATVGSNFSIGASLRNTEFPPILGSIDSVFFDGEGDYTVEGWTCGEDLGKSLDVGVFADGYAVSVEKADLDAEAAVAEACGTAGSFAKYRFSVEATPEDLGCLNAWDNRMSVIAGLDGFEKSLGEVPRAGREPWLAANVPGVGLPGDARYGATFHSGSPERHFVGDFNGDQKADYMWENEGWWVALSNGQGFQAPQQWLDKFRPGTTYKTYNQDHPARHFVTDINGDQVADYMWENWGWYVALSNGAHFGHPFKWLDQNIPNVVDQTFSDSWWLQFVGDFNGDGKADLMWKRGDWWWVALQSNLSNGFDTPTPWLFHKRPGTQNEWTWSDVPQRNIIGDFNGDGRADFMYYKDGWWVALANLAGNGFETPTQWLGEKLPGTVNEWTYSEGPERNFTGDFNDDGRADFMWRRKGWWVALANANGTGFEAATKWLVAKTGGEFSETYNPTRPERHFIADFDGDGSDDYLWGYHGWKVALSEGDRFATPRLWLPGETEEGWTFNNDFPERHFVADFTGDGRPDYLWEKYGWHVASTLLPDTTPGDPDGDCDGFADAVDNCPVDANPDQADVEGDGVGNACDTECADGVNNDDGDSFVDFPADPGCATADSALEAPECDDDIDNDGDGKPDALDYNCVAPYIDDERYPLINECTDGLDNDGDGQVDYYGGPQGQPADVWCANNTGKEDMPYHQCGLGFEVAPVLLVLMYLRGRRRRAARC